MRRFRIQATADRLRDAAFQPVADRLDEVLGLNCFRLGAMLAGAFASVDIATTVHLGAAGEPAPRLALRCAFLSAVCVAAVRVDDFGRSEPEGRGDVVHPLFRDKAVFCVGYVLACAGGLAYALATCGGHGSAAAAWHVAEWGDDLPLALGLSFCTCAWRRPPMARPGNPAGTRDRVPGPLGIHRGNDG